MLRLNLVSEKQKKEIKLRHTYELVKKVNSLLIIFTLFSAFFIVAAKSILQNNFNKVVEQTSLVQRNSKSYNEQAQKINRVLNSVKYVQDDFVAWSDLLSFIPAYTNEGISLELIDVKQEKNSLILTGQAATRDDLLEFKNSLEAVDIFTEVNFPIKSLFEKENIAFNVSAQLNMKLIKE